MDTTLGRDRLREFIDLIVGSLDEHVDGADIAARGYLSTYHGGELIVGGTPCCPVITEGMSEGIW